MAEDFQGVEESTTGRIFEPLGKRSKHKLIHVLTTFVKLGPCHNESLAGTGHARMVLLLVPLGRSVCHMRRLSQFACLSLLCISMQA